MRLPALRHFHYRFIFAIWLYLRGYGFTLPGGPYITAGRWTFVFHTALPRDA